MRVVNLTSGSDGNMTYVEDENIKILVDIGISCKEAEKRPAVVVLPERDTPGNNATHWNKPTVIASLTDISLPVLNPFTQASDKNRRIAVNIKAHPSKIISPSPSTDTKKSLKK